MKLALLVPVLGRPQRVEPFLASARKATPDARILFIADPDDEPELDALEVAGAEVIAPGGSYAQKINAGYEATDESLFFMGADDITFHPDWFPRACEYLKEEIDVVGTNDLLNPRVMRGEHSTHTLVRRSYIERESGVVDEPGKVLHEGYAHEYCDDEFIQTAQARGVYAHAFDALVEHHHPLVNKAPDDETYRKGRQGTIASRRLFRRRKRLWQR